MSFPGVEDASEYRYVFWRVVEALVHWRTSTCPASEWAACNVAGRRSRRSTVPRFSVHLCPSLLRISSVMTAHGMWTVLVRVLFRSDLSMNSESSHCTPRFGGLPGFGGLWSTSYVLASAIVPACLHLVGVLPSIAITKTHPEHVECQFWTLSTRRADGTRTEHRTAANSAILSSTVMNFGTSWSGSIVRLPSL